VFCGEEHADFFSFLRFGCLLFFYVWQLLYSARWECDCFTSRLIDQYIVVEFVLLAQGCLVTISFDDSFVSSMYGGFDFF
jgi:hypothetical protein